jgi:N-hydroxyarylamine O-acetyltransferase
VVGEVDEISWWNRVEQVLGVPNQDAVQHCILADERQLPRTPRQDDRASLMLEMDRATEVLGVLREVGQGRSAQLEALETKFGLRRDEPVRNHAEHVVAIDVRNLHARHVQHALDPNLGSSSRADDSETRGRRSELAEADEGFARVSDARAARDHVVEQLERTRWDARSHSQPEVTPAIGLLCELPEPMKGCGRNVRVGIAEHLGIDSRRLRDCASIEPDCCETPQQRPHMSRSHRGAGHLHQGRVGTASGQATGQHLLARDARIPARPVMDPSQAAAYATRMTVPPIAPCPPDLTEQVLERLGFSRAPEPDAAGLSAAYRRWCEKVPFDNVLKRRFLSTGAAGPLPGSSPDEFFRQWLAHGVGGTCWAGANALGSLLTALGFSARRAVATMLPVPHLTDPNHGLIVVDLEDGPELVDASILHGVPIPLNEPAPPGVIGDARLRRDADGTTYLDWRPLHRPSGMPCRIDTIGVDDREFDDRHEMTRVWSFFNYALYVRVLRGHTSVGFAAGRRVEIGSDGSVRATPLEAEERDRFLVREVGMSEEIVDGLPGDDPIPPPPGIPPERWNQMMSAAT